MSLDRDAALGQPGMDGSEGAGAQDGGEDGARLTNAGVNQRLEALTGRPILYTSTLAGCEEIIPFGYDIRIVSLADIVYRAFVERDGILTERPPLSMWAEGMSRAEALARAALLLLEHEAQYTTDEERLRWQQQAGTTEMRQRRLLASAARTQELMTANGERLAALLVEITTLLDRLQAAGTEGDHGVSTPAE